MFRLLNLTKWSKTSWKESKYVVGANRMKVMGEQGIDDLDLNIIGNLFNHYSKFPLC